MKKNIIILLLFIASIYELYGQKIMFGLSLQNGLGSNRAESPFSKNEDDRFYICYYNPTLLFRNNTHSNFSYEIGLGHRKIGQLFKPYSPTNQQFPKVGILIDYYVMPMNFYYTISKNKYGLYLTLIPSLSHKMETRTFEPNASVITYSEVKAHVFDANSWFGIVGVGAEYNFCLGIGKIGVQLGYQNAIINGNYQELYFGVKYMIPTK